MLRLAHQPFDGEMRLQIYGNQNWQKVRKTAHWEDLLNSYYPCDI